MSDYLGRLASRSLGLLRTARPRLASRFEPVTPEALPLVEPFRRSQVSTERSITLTAPTRPAPMPAMSPDAPSRSVEQPLVHPPRHTTPAIRGESEAPVGTGSVEPPSVALPQPIPDSGVRSVRLTASRSSRTESLDAPDGDDPSTGVLATTQGGAARATRGKHDQHGRGPRSEGDGRRSRIERTRAEAIASRDTGRHHVGERRPSPARASGPRDPVPPTPVSRAHQPFVDTAPSAATVPEGGRTVHVTIGRVDVRATAPESAVPPRRPRPPSPGPSLSLDEYLKSRSDR